MTRTPKGPNVIYHDRVYREPTDDQLGWLLENELIEWCEQCDKGGYSSWHPTPNAHQSPPPRPKHPNKLQYVEGTGPWAEIKKMKWMD